MKDNEVPTAEWLDGYQTGREDEEGFVWNFPEPEPFYGEGDYVYAHYADGHRDWERPWNCNVTYSLEQQYFEENLKMWAMIASIYLILLAILTTSFYL